MGLASLLLGEENPFAQWTNQNQNLLGAIGAGLGQGQNIQGGLSAGLSMVPQAKMLDREAGEKLKAEKLAENQLNATTNWVQSNYPQYAHLPPAQAWEAAMLAEREKISGGGNSGLINAGGGSIYNPNTGEWIKDPNAAGGAGGPYDGTSMDAQNWNLLLTGDPSTPEYAAAWSQLTAPKMTLKETANGVVPVYETPSIPDSIRRPTTGFGGAQPTAAPVPANTAPAAPSWTTPAFGQPPSPTSAAPGPAVGAPLPGTKAAPTEARLRNAAIGTVLASEVPKVGNNFKALTDPQGQLLAMLGPAGNPWQSAQYQQAATALGSSISQILYSLSGATANPGEVQKQIEFLTPAFGDKPAVIADKLDRFKTLTRAVAQSSGDPEVIKQVEDAIAALGLGQTGPGAPVADPIAAADALLNSGKY